MVGLMVCLCTFFVSPELFLQGWQLVKVRLPVSFKKGFRGVKRIVRAPFLLTLNCFLKLDKRKMLWLLAKT